VRCALLVLGVIHKIYTSHPQACCTNTGRGSLWLFQAGTPPKRALSYLARTGRRDKRAQSWVDATLIRQRERTLRVTRSTREHTYISNSLHLSKASDVGLPMTSHHPQPSLPTLVEPFLAALLAVASWPGMKPFAPVPVPSLFTNREAMAHDAASAAALRK
jgi:hypothetical protein